MMGIFALPFGSVAAGATAGVVFAVSQAQAGQGIDIWTLVEKGGAPMAGVLLVALIEVVRRHDRAYKIIEAKDATILEMSKREVSAIDTANEIASAQMAAAKDTQKQIEALTSLVRELVTLLRGKLDIG